MAKYYGDLPCVKLCGVIHVTVSSTKCACGESWDRSHSRPSKNCERINIIWREKAAVTCPVCRQIVEEK